ncbi:hypothetical protein [Capnocytophaga canis]|uniref:hypothetical protein n=1 Tax=Capnocytophaga canis TaxID=1848903 RepID=UPI0015628CB2|nr:hypothetical protein [Capnocytophaga canis]
MGKITAKHFLNVRAVPRIEKNQNKFPLFFMVVFNRMTIRRMSIFLENQYFSEKDFETQKIDKTQKKAIEHEQNILYKIVEKFKHDKESNTLTNNFLYFNKSYAYTSKNEDLNILNSYINYYTTYTHEAIINEIYKNIKTELTEKLKNTFDFSDNENLIDEILDLFHNNDVFAGIPYDDFLQKNISEHAKKLLFLQFCLSEFQSNRELKTGVGFISLFEWLFEFDKMAREYKKFVSKDTETINTAQKIGIDIDETMINLHLNEIKKVIFDPLFYEKNRI